MGFDSYSVPMNVQEPAAPVITAHEIQSFVRKVEDKFDLPRGLLFKRQSHRKLYRRYEQHYLADMRFALISYIRAKRSISLIKLGNALNVDHSTIVHAEQTANDRVITHDEKFVYYLHAIQQIPL